MNKRRRNRRKKDTTHSPHKAGWRPDEWARDVGCSRSYVFVLLERAELDSIKLGTMRVITTPPAEYLACLAAKQAESPDHDSQPTPSAPTIGATRPS
jgi:hypothetical protein